MSKMSQTEKDIPIEFITPKQELDEPPDPDETSNDLTPIALDTLEKDKQRKEKRYFSSLWLIVGCLLFLLIIYGVEVYVSFKLNNEASGHTDGIIEIIKTLLLTLSGYLFARKNDED